MKFFKYLLLKALKLFSYILYLLPDRVRYLGGDFFGILWFDILRIRRNIIFENLEKAFPGISIREKKKIGRRSCKRMGWAFMDYFVMPFVSEKNFHRFFVTEGLEILDNELEKNHGALLLSLHLGSYDFIGVAFGVLQYPLNIISKEFNYQWLNDIWFGLRKSKGVRFISDRKSTFEIFRALKNNEMVTFVLDQYMGTPLGVKTQFFGHPTGTAKSLAMFAEKSKASVLPVYSYRREDGRVALVVENSIGFEKLENREKTVLHMTQKYNDYLEEIVRKYPEDWLWVHRRWKRFR